MEDKKEEVKEEEKKEEEKEVKVEEVKKVVIKEEKEEKEEDKLDKLVKAFKISYEPGTQVLSMDCLKQIMSASASLSEPEFIELTESNRKTRRQMKKEGEVEAYYAMLGEYTEEMQNLMVKH